MTARLSYKNMKKIINKFLLLSKRDVKVHYSIFSFTIILLLIEFLSKYKLDMTWFFIVYVIFAGFLFDWKSYYSTNYEKYNQW